MQAITWNDLPSIHDVPPIDDTDERCLEEIRTVLARHDKAARFGVALLHQHFHLADAEVLVEHCDMDTRTLVTAPQLSSDEILRRFIPTVWRFDKEIVQACSFCPTHDDQHDGYKESH
jgi:predicted nucleotide-binding protein (sugar kinase/HSP70/actin superfamily)